MSKAEALRLRDVRDAYRLLDGCRDLGNDPALWHGHMFDGLARLFGTMLAMGGEGWWDRPTRTIRAVSGYGVSADPAARELFLAYHRAKGQEVDPFLRALQSVPGRLVTRTRRQMVPDREWYRSATFDEFRRPLRVAHEMTSVLQRSPDGAITVITLTRTTGDPDFSPREQRLFSFFHAELGRLVGRSLVSATEPGVAALTPRLRQTLACLLEGDGEKQVAARLGLSWATVHQYVTALYRHFGVRSRAQLLVHILRRGSAEMTI